MDLPTAKGLRRALLYLVPTALIIFIFASTDAHDQIQTLTRRSKPHPLSAILSQRSLNALQSDKQLRDAYTSVLSMASSSVSDLAERFPEIPHLAIASSYLATRYDAIASSTEATDVAKRSLLSNLLQPLGNLFSGLTKGLSLNGPAFFLGVGLGQGGASGLGLATANKAASIADKVVSSSNQSATGLNPALQNAAQGAAATLLGAVNISSLLGQGTSQIPAIALNLAEGVGNGTAAGLGLSARAKALGPPTGSQISDIAGTLGFGVSKTVGSNIDLGAFKGLNLNSLLGGVGLGSVAMAAGEGLGNGTATGLKLAQRAPPPTTGNNVIDAVGGFTFGLSKSLTQSVNLGGGGLNLLGGNLLGGGTGNSSTGGFDLVSMLPAAAMGLGQGIAEGVSVGLGLSPDQPTPMGKQPNGQIDVEGVAQNFARGLSAGFVSNGTAMKLLGSLGGGGNGSSPGGLGNLNIARAAQGLARGLVQGVGDGIDSVGGVQAIVDGKAKLPTNLAGAMNTSIDFNDSVNGAASGFGLGLGGQGVLVATQLVNNLKNGGTTGTTATTTTTTNTTAKRWMYARKEKGLVPRQDTTTGTADIPFLNGTLQLNVSNILNAKAISAVAQSAVNALTCIGVGGLFDIGAGLQKSGAISTKVLSNSGSDSTLALVKQLVPSGIVEIVSQGNSFNIDLQKGLDKGDAASALTVNGNTVTTLVIFLVVHILFAILIFLNALPAALGLEGARNILDRLKKTYVLPNIPRWVTIIWLFAIAPGTIISLIFGILAMGTAGHFRTAHGILGLITTILTVPAAILHYVVKIKKPSSGQPGPEYQESNLPLIRTILNQVLLNVGLATALTGFVDLSTISLCLTQSVAFESAILFGFGIAGTFVLGAAVSGLDTYLGFRERRALKRLGQAGEKQRGATA